MTRPNSAELDGTFTALADPTRRAMIRALLQSPRRAGELAAIVDMSAPALSRHLRVLRKAGLIAERSIEEDARVRVYCVQNGAFDSIRGWLTQVENMWQQLEAFKAYAEGARPKRKPS